MIFQDCQDMLQITEHIFRMVCPNNRLIALAGVDNHMVLFDCVHGWLDTDSFMNFIRKPLPAPGLDHIFFGRFNDIKCFCQGFRFIKNEFQFQLACNSIQLFRRTSVTFIVCVIDLLNQSSMFVFSWLS